ncbi:4Fe-4S dicluster domain-containing protein [Desulfocurvus sp.]|jgi:ferredoxin|uniref:4Fe-4S dicluster domain-containing protein n=1 Tax=Desulfocurvus sp. TaxID=2871698 RepID=UPI0025BCD171|nr:4Fe-4S dicluster domain-containing protein [Desulfocurvus sp.]MCK9239998.1 4Fe-4S dicluster domain-containing protein [Desulfocurvus sp.]
MLDFLKILAGNVFKGPSTDGFPFTQAHTPRRFRGKVHLNPALCVGCTICRHVCAGGAIHIAERPDGSGYDYTLWHNTCALCGLCQHYCPTGALSTSGDWHNAHPQSEKYQWCERHFVPFLSCDGCGAPLRPLPPALTGRIYADNHVDAARLMRLCPRCRQIETAMHAREASHEAQSGS